MSKRKTTISVDNMAIKSKSKNKVMSCSTPERDHSDSPSRDSDSICDSEAASPVSFLCTQDGAEGVTDVVWNYYTPKSEHNTASRLKNSTPLTRKAKRVIKQKIVEKPLPKRKITRATQKNTQLFQDLIELNQNIHQFIDKNVEKNNKSPAVVNFESDDDIFSECSDFSPKNSSRVNSRCLRKNLLSSKFNKPECEYTLESDDSMNEYLIKASQAAEENILKANNKSCDNKISMKVGSKLKMDSFSPVANKNRQNDLSMLVNDSFDNFLGNLTDSALDKLTQMPIKYDTPNKTDNANNSEWIVKELKAQESPSSKFFGRHNSMPESPTITSLVQPSTSGMVFGRHNSLPYENDDDLNTVDSSPIRCTPDEIQRKHKQAREKLLAKRLLPFTTSTQVSQETQKLSHTQQDIPAKRTQFQPKVASSNNNTVLMTRVNSMPVNYGSTTSTAKTVNYKSTDNKTNDIKILIEKKRQEALMRLRKRQT